MSCHVLSLLLGGSNMGKQHLEIGTSVHCPGIEELTLTNWQGLSLTLNVFCLSPDF
jgi:hypothetical protein